MSRQSAVAFIPFKRDSQRVPRKNFRDFLGRPLYQHIITAARESAAFTQIYINTDSDEIKDYANSLGLGVIDRPPELNADTINGNDLLTYDATQVAEGDLLFQLFGTAPLLSAQTIAACVTELTTEADYDSILTATEETGWFWWQGLPVNFMPHAFPRSQDAKHLIKESTGLYGITRAAWQQYRQRIGARPYLHLIEPIEAVDLDTEFDFRQAEALAQQRQLVRE